MIKLLTDRKRRQGGSYSYTSIMRLGDDAYSTFAPAKLNITLTIGDKEHDGIHKISSIMQAVSLYDHITLERVRTENIGLEGCFVDNNIISKALDELSKEAGRKLPSRIILQKVIPIAAGMGGGSSDAAAVLRLANCAFDLQMDLQGLERVAQRVGNDVAFLLRGGRAIVEGGTAHKIEPANVPDLYYLIARPHKRLLTEDMYKLHDDTGKSFTQLALDLCPDTSKLLSVMKKDSVENGVTGKGPTVFAGYATYKECEITSGKISWLNGDIFITRAIEAFG